jgi:hypothetical protein
MEVTHQAEVKRAAIQFLQQRQERFARHTGDSPLVVPLHAHPSKERELSRHPEFAQFDIVDLHTMAKTYVLGRIPCVDRAVCVALLLSCLGTGRTLSSLRVGTLQITQGRKFRS